MEAERNLHTFHEFPENATLAVADRPLLWAGADGRARYRLWPGRGFIFGKADAGARMRAPVQGTPSISGMSGLAAVVVNPCGEFGTKNGVQEVVKTSSSSPVCMRPAAAGMRWMRDDCDGRRNGDREGESAGEE